MQLRRLEAERTLLAAYQAGSTAQSVAPRRGAENKCDVVARRPTHVFEQVHVEHVLRLAELQDRFKQLLIVSNGEAETRSLPRGVNCCRSFMANIKERAGRYETPNR
eukprot:6208699-Pleurochrysis_carterae.AAC.5